MQISNNNERKRYRQTYTMEARVDISPAIAVSCNVHAYFTFTSHILRHIVMTNIAS